MERGAELLGFTRIETRQRDCASLGAATSLFVVDEELTTTPVSDAGAPARSS